MKNIALVTGGLGGLGTAICRALANSGYTVISTHSRAGDYVKEWQEKQQAAGFSFVAVQCDVADWNSVESCVNKITNEHGEIAVLINNAGITADATLKKMSYEQWQKVLRTNLDSVFNLSRHVIANMIKNNFGRIVNISSINGQKGQFGQTNYSAAKAGIHGFTMALAQEVARNGITVNTIAPGYLATDMVLAVPEDIRNKIIAQIPVGRLGNPTEIASLVNYLVSAEAGFITGAELAINGGQHMM